MTTTITIADTTIADSSITVEQNIQLAKSWLHWIGTADTPDLQAMTDALRSHRPGETVEIVVRRGATVTTLRATLGTRGG